MSALGLPALPDPPALLEANEPPEARGLARDSVRLLIADEADGSITHARFDELPRLLSPGDLVVVNTSGTLAAALPVVRNDGQRLELRLSTPVEGKDPERFWIVELRSGDAPFGSVEVGERFVLPGGASAEILAPYAGRPALARAPRAARTAGLATSTSTAARSATATFRAAGRSRRTRTSTRSSPAAPRCRAPAGRSRRS